ncbi:hypothetical protein CYMTET_54503 [Cymbomonas tetramitiformis]|uniref:Kinesin motor domain-containing protein n=1 Tax=Cymbomonas tetramitiformis TaxID=36881 RepID=A0AAE0EPA0_9CHLO|nr:hypothetical protein CYMTET_54503 [Cymbomonas tetramitiformis]|eukprot:gene13569-16045_t
MVVDKSDASVETPKRSGWEIRDEEERRAKNHEGDPHDIRALRIAHSAAFVKGIKEYRQRQPTNTTSSEMAPSSSVARVFVRARPLFAHEAQRGEWNCVSADPALGDLVVHSGSERVVAGKGIVPSLGHQSYPGVTPLMTDEDVYKGLQYLVQTAAEGGKSTLFMYGMTGSGKTHSMAGIHQRAPADIFGALSGAGTVQLTAYELVGKRCFDLLSEDDETKREVYLRIGEDDHTHVCGNTERATSTPSELQQMLQVASGRRETAATGTNLSSSRSHAVYHLLLPSRGSFMMIDLAGNEGNLETFFHDREQMAEAAEINASLMAVNSCLRARATGAGHAPFRESTLTRVLRDAFTEPSSCLALLACVSPASSHLERTTCTLKNAVKLLGDGPLPTMVVEDVAAPSTQPVDQDLKPPRATFSQSRQMNSKERKAEAMRSLALTQLFADLKLSWGGEHPASWDGDGWAMLHSEAKRPQLAARINDEQLVMFFDQAKQQLESDEFNFAAFENVCLSLSGHADLKVSALVKMWRASSGLPLCTTCLQDYATQPAVSVKKFSTYNGKCPGCFKPY